MDLLIRGGMIVDGTGAPPRPAEVAIAGDTIIEVGGVHVSAKKILDATGLIVSPGFIDIHSHTDHMLLANPLAESKLLQGVTCEVGGNCGSSAAPLNEEQAREAGNELRPHGPEVSWHDTGEFLSVLEKAGIGLNFATLVGHGNLRGGVIGYEARAAGPEELREMQRRAAKSLQEGAFGISAGLIYPPGCFADAKELAAVCAAAQGRGFFAVHMRDEGAGLLEAVEEVIGVARAANIALQISHHKVTGERNWGLVKKSLEKIAEAREEGLDITVDVYPYEATNTGLSAVVPDWMKAGGREALLARLQDSAMLKRWAQEWGERGTDLARWQEYMVSRVFAEEQKQFEGKRIAEICQELDKSPLETVAQLLLNDKGGTEMIRYCIAEKDIEEVLSRPWAMIGSDAGAKDFSGGWGCPHPRGFGTFPRVLAKYVRERGIFTLAEAVRKMTSLPAGRLGIRDRGRIAPGCKADLVIFDAAEIADQATYQHPARPPSGIEWIIVNGVVAAEQGKLTGARPGKVLRA